MKQQVFESQHAALWTLMDSILDQPDKNISDQFPHQYRTLCQHLAVAKSRRYSPHLVARLNRLVLGAHHLLYHHNRDLRPHWLWFVAHGFPAAIRQNRVYIYWSAALFLLPLVALGVSCFFNSELVYSLMDSIQVRHMESMYDPDATVLGRERDSQTDLAMFGFYIYNNIGIGFRTFAGGIAFGLGSIFFLVYNGMVIGGTAGHLTQLGYIDTFYGFVTGHAAFELTAIVLCGAAGLRLGFSLVDPGPLRRVDAVRIAAREAIMIVYGAAIMLVIAAFIEAFWSSSRSIAVEIKYAVGAVMALLLSLYFIFFGRAGGPE